MDGLVLNVKDGVWYLTVTVDRLPEAWTMMPIPFDPAMFASPYVDVEVLGGSAVVAVADPPPTGSSDRPTRTP